MNNPIICLPPENTIFCLESLSKEELRELAEKSISYSFISGPIYHYLNKKLACICLEEEQTELAIFHLAESHGCSLRHQANIRYESIIRKQQTDNSQSQMCNIELLKDIVALDGNYASSKFEGLKNRLGELPSEWTIVQLTIQYDPLLRFTHQSPKQQSSIHITRLTCGALCDSISKIGQGGPPVSFCVPPDPQYDALSIMKALNELIEGEGSSRENRRYKDRLRYRQDQSSKLKTIIQEFESLLKGWNCLLPGHLLETELQKTICTKVDKIIQGFPKLRGISARARQILYLLASCPLEFGNYNLDAINAVIKDGSVAKDVYQSIKKVHSEFRGALLTAARHPVILILDELLDTFPMEMLGILKDHPVSRVPSIHFAHALYREHRDTVFSTGVKKESGYYIVNPSGDLDRCETEFRDLLSDIAPKWDGVYGQPPTEVQFIDALENRSMFLYCGHGGGNQYAATYGIEQVRTRAVSFLFGCSSSKIMPLGGRIEGQSIFNSYMIAGSPCVLGMLWSVTDQDINNISKHLLKTWLGSNALKSADDITECMRNLTVWDKYQALSCPSPLDLLQIIPIARKEAQHLVNAAGLVARGLPVRLAN